MCGIVGAISFHGDACSDDVLQNMAGSLAHRGPDEATFFADEFLSLGFRRLSIIDVSDGHQPIWNEDNDILIAVNGEVYNHLELRGQLEEKHHFRTQSDSEIVLHLYEEMGVEAFNQLNGMFAIVIWDKRMNTLVFARDRLGIKPLYYTLADNKLIFASELKALLMHPDCPREIEWDDLEILNLQQKSDVSTYVKDVHYLEAGSYALFTEGAGLKKTKYWSIDDAILSSLSSTKPPEQFCDEYLDLLKDSVDKRLMSEVPVGVFLSGGIDSSLITAMAAKKNSQLHCFTVVERTTYRAGDVEQARKLTKQYNIPFYPVLFDTDAIAEKFKLINLEEMLYMIESPRFDPEWLFKSELHRAAKYYVPDLKVMLLGQGADEFAGGYSNFLGGHNSDWMSYIKNDVSPSVRFYQQRSKKVPARLQSILSAKDQHTISDYHEKMKLLIYQMQYFNLWHEDRTSSFHGIESRVPFLDHRLVELLASIPEAYHSELFWDKQIVRRALHQTTANYPKEKKKVPFFATDDISSINEFAWKICVNVYPEFRLKYLHERSELVINASFCEELFSSVQIRRHDMYDSAWRLIELMAIAIFSQYLKEPQNGLARISKVKRNPLPLVKDSEWSTLDELYKSSPENQNNIWCSNDDIINIPKYCEILNPLTEDDGSTCLILSCKGKQVRRLSIDDQYYWIVQVIDEMGRYINNPKNIEYWNQKCGANKQDFTAIVNQLIGGGLLERVEKAA